MARIVGMTETLEKSLEELMHEAWILAMDVTYSELAPDNTYLTPRQGRIGTPEEDDMVWGWADGLMHKYYQSRATGRCSWKAMQEFDVTQFEENVKRDIATMTKLLAKVGKPVKLDFAEMQRRGYRGSWAGLPS